MLTEFVAGVALASTLLAPTATQASDAPDNVTIKIPLVREELGAWYTLAVDQTCPDSNPYVHLDRVIGSLPEHVYSDFDALAVGGGPATRIRGPITNWNLSGRYVSLDLKCTSDPSRAVKVPPRYP